jgi:hypothetical protein
MGAYNSKQQCKDHYNITVICPKLEYNNVTNSFPSGISPGDFEPDADVAGAGVSIIKLY